ncbi:hypothetical protein CDAR_188791 [Caerostris darwini]|uniref:Uncharacterized protein n=1 Tax=Caerostris darwini TaxID=1538125 RepID=A0AAV4VZL4_9ARAC|nr:hypothetical protein CDAR_188791 [Caerostris darwini]
MEIDCVQLCLSHHLHSTANWNISFLTPLIMSVSHIQYLQYIKYHISITACDSITSVIVSRISKTMDNLAYSKMLFCLLRFLGRQHVLLLSETVPVYFVD